MNLINVNGAVIDTCRVESFATVGDYDAWNTKPYAFFVYNQNSHKISEREPNACGDDCDPGEYNAYIPESHETLIEFEKMRFNLQVKCAHCGKEPHEISEYVSIARQEGYVTPIDAVIHNEGTYNPANGHFYCTSCYIKLGMPIGVAK